MRTSLLLLSLACLILHALSVTAYKCTPGKTFKDNCNTCVCPSSGLKKDTACTQMNCINPEHCIPGSSFTADDRCNTCYCPPTGLKKFAACTLMACIPINDDTCTPNEAFVAEDGCNTCRCPRSGLKRNAPCTRMACPRK